MRKGTCQPAAVLMSHPSRFVFMLALLLPLAAGAASTRELLDRYTGRWVGTFTVSGFDGTVLQTLKVEQQYWWEGDEQRAIGVFDRQGELTWVSSRIYEREGTLLCETSIADQPHRTYAARVRGDAITWLPTNVVEATRKQVRETILRRGDRWILRSEGFEHVGPADQLVPVRVEGELEKVP